MIAAAQIFPEAFHDIRFRTAEFFSNLHTGMLHGIRKYDSCAAIAAAPLNTARCVPGIPSDVKYISCFLFQAGLPGAARRNKDRRDNRVHPPAGRERTFIFKNRSN
ncbi:hypothetical protein FPZ43_18265 [Mucilaginibacter pallidiroseus]|uniref:Uncharacterized protein n=1 Tax=Mucilaginibacter pallidiroseus TaxID=2599295 RepID=A0A563TYF5_9SPHI|nr:hypothetical protein [Mucilaginibacter pallidiroseus]TWR24376.1 hypothetical protein FPZ43_18265 [Mucilaginibacter pallidiroseus]